MTGKVAPAKCGACDETRHVEVAGAIRRCPTCHPLSPKSAAALRERLVQLQAEMRDVEEQLAAAEAPGWQRGPGPVRPP